jgi:tetratricopeptide (TPR) repeat protein
MRSLKILKKIIFFLVCAPLSAQVLERPYWYTLEQGKSFFRNGAYGKALMAFEDARHGRKTLFEKMEKDFIYVLSLHETRRMKDSLMDIEKFIKDMRYDKASVALDELFFRVPRGSLGNSASLALDALGKLKNYPEAEYWIGEVYRVEGELNIALQQYQKAYDQRENLENAGFAVDILYKMVDTLKIKQDFVEMEKRALDIITRDTLWSGNPGTRNAMAKLLEADAGGMNRFLTLYRYDNAQTERAHRVMGLYYYAYGRHSAAQEHLMFSFLINSTVLINEIIRNRYDFEFTTLDSFLDEAEANETLLSYMEKNEYYKTLYYLGAALYANGKTASARGFWTILSKRGKAGEWAYRASSQLKSPVIEKVRETL